MTGYWIVVASVVVAVLAVLVALLADLPEWQRPLRHRPISLLYRIDRPGAPARDPSAARWRAAIESMDPPLVETSETGTSAGTPNGTGSHQMIEAAIRRRPQLVVIVGAPELMLSGHPAAAVAAEIEFVVSRLAQSGCPSIIQGFVPPMPEQGLARSALDFTALSRLARCWNDLLVDVTQGYGARVVDQPEHLHQTVHTALSRPLALEISSSDASNLDPSGIQWKRRDWRGQPLRRSH